MQNRAMREYDVPCGWTIAFQIREFGCGTAKQEVREKVYIGASGQEITGRTRLVSSTGSDYNLW